MAIDSICSGCGKTLRVADEYAGRKARCPLCGAIYDVAQPGFGLGPTGVSTRPLESPLPTLQPLESSRDSWNNLNPQTPAVTSNPSSMSSSNLTPGTNLGVPASSSLNPLFFVRTPDATVYGPVSANTVSEWIQQGRLDDTCHIRPESQEQWLGIPAWQFQQKQRANPVMGPTVSARPNDPNYFGAAPVPSIQSAGYPKTGNGIWVVVLAILSWILCMTGIGAPICSIIAIVLARSELANIRSGRSPESERALTLVGMWLAIINLFIVVGVFMLFIAAVILNP